MDSHGAWDDFHLKFAGGSLRVVSDNARVFPLDVRKHKIVSFGTTGDLTRLLPAHEEAW